LKGRKNDGKNKGEKRNVAHRITKKKTVGRTPTEKISQEELLPKLSQNETGNTKIFRREEEVNPSVCSYRSKQNKGLEEPTHT